MFIFAAQETQSEQQDEENPFSVVSDPVEETPSTVNNSDASNGQSNLVFNRDANASKSSRTGGITDDLKMPGDLPSNADGNTAQRLNDDGRIADNEVSDEELNATVAVQPKQNEQSTPLTLADVHWSIWLLLIVGALGVTAWIGSNLINRRTRSKRPRTKANTFKPVTNRLKHNSVQPVAMPKANGSSSSVRPRRVAKSSRRKGSPDSDFGTTVRETAVVGAATAAEHHLDESFGQSQQAMDFETASVAVLDEQIDGEIGLFDGEAKESTYRSNGSAKSKNGSLIADLTAEISSLKESLCDVKLDRNLRSQLETAKAELEWKNSLLEKSERVADDRETALNIAVQAQTELREKVVALSSELEKVKEKFQELEEREQKLQDELAAERTAMVALHRMVESEKSSD